MDELNDTLNCSWSHLCEKEDKKKKKQGLEAETNVL